MGGRGAAEFSALLALLLMAVLFTPPVGAWYAVQCGLIGLLIPEFALRGFRPSRSILWSTASALIMTALMVAIFSFTSGTNPHLFAEKEINEGLSQALKLYEQQAGLSAQDMETIRQGMHSIKKLMIQIYPAVATINTGLVSMVSLLLFNRMATSRSIELNLPQFREFKVPEILIWLLIIAGFSVLAPTTLISTPALNILIVLAALYFMQGLAVLITYCDRSGFSGTLKVFLAILLLTQPYLNGVVAIVGIFDYWGDFRVPRNNQE